MLRPKGAKEKKISRNFTIIRFSPLNRIKMQMEMLQATTMLGTCVYVAIKCNKSITDHSSCPKTNTHTHIRWSNESTTP